MIDPDELPDAEDRRPVRRALLSVYDKSGLVDLARVLREHDVELISTGGTARAIRDAGLPVTDVSDVTGHPEILEGRVKTLHPTIHGAILARRSLEADRRELADRNIDPVDLVVANLYPFEEARAREDATEALLLEQIDIGGPTLLRAAAKNYFDVGVVTDPEQYGELADELTREDGALTLATRRRWAGEAFRRTATYDRAVGAHFDSSGSGTRPRSDGEAEKPTTDGSGSDLPPSLTFDLPRAHALRYGENPHQSAAHYGRPEDHFEKLHGKDLSFNNLQDLTAALDLIAEFRDADPTCAILKHTNPCGVAVRDTVEAAYRAAFATDRQSPYGGIVVVNRPLDRATAEAIDEIFTELIIAPEYEEGVLAYLTQKEKRRLVRARPEPGERAADPGLPGSSAAWDLRSAIGGLLLQESDPALPALETLRTDWTIPTTRSPEPEEWRDLDVAWRVAKHVKSNAIVYAGDGATLGIGAGQMSRIDASEIAVAKSRKSGLDLEGSVVASDAFFPFSDGLEAAAEAGARAAIQPGGSIRDEEVIDAADEHDVAMVLTGRRHFRH